MLYNAHVILSAKRAATLYLIFDSNEGSTRCGRMITPAVHTTPTELFSTCSAAGYTMNEKMKAWASVDDDTNRIFESLHTVH